MKKIKISAETKDYLPLEQLTELQGELKSLSEKNFIKLALSIEMWGFMAAVHVWKSPDGTNYILDGTQRTRTTRKMVATGEFECPPIPVVFVPATDINEAKRKVLAMASQYGKVEDQGLYEFSESMNLEPAELFQRYNFPEISEIKFMENFYGDAFEEVEEVKDKKEFLIIIECQNENEQSQIFDQLQRDGIQCKVI